MQLHTAYAIDGQPVYGTYGASRLEDLQRVKNAGMNVVLGGHAQLDITTPEGKFCAENGIKIMHHLSSHVYHGIRLAVEVDANQTTIPLLSIRGTTKEAPGVIQIDDELIHYERMTTTELTGCERGYGETVPALHEEGVILFWPEACATDVAEVKDLPGLYGYYVLDDSPGLARSALRAMYRTIHSVDPDPTHPVCAGYGDAGSPINFGPEVCDVMLIYWYPADISGYRRDWTSEEVQWILTKARDRVPGIPFMGVYQAFDGTEADTGQGVPTADQLREQMEDFVREGACGLISFICHAGSLRSWSDIEPLERSLTEANREIRRTGGLTLREGVNP